jgi:subtilisin-like proprotein convertase family protein
MLQVRKAAKPLTSSVAVAFTPKVWFNDFRTPLLAEYLVDLEVRVTDYADDEIATKAPLADPHFTGTPTAPTPAAGNDSTTLATTAFVTHAVSVGGGGGGGGGGGAFTPTVFTSADPPVAIPDGVSTPATVISFDVSGSGSVGDPQVGDLTVQLQVTHTYVGDVHIDLKSPDGTQITIDNGRGGSYQNLGTPGTTPPNFSFDDTAANSIVTDVATSPVTGAYRPENPLAGFTGLPIAGTWQLLVYDSDTPDSGTINQARLVFTPRPASIQWREPVTNTASLPSAPNQAGDVRVTLSDNLIHIWGSDNAWHTIGGASLASSHTVTADYMLVLADVGKIVEVDVASGTTVVSIPSNLAVAFPVGSVIQVFRYNAGVVQVSPTLGVTIRSRFTGASSVYVGHKWASVTLRQRALDEWIAEGDVSDVSA